MSRLRIGLISEAYPPVPVVGAIRASKVARAFRDAGHDVTVLTPRSSRGRDTHAKDHGIRIIEVASWPGPHDVLKRLRRLLVRRSRSVGVAMSEELQPVRLGFIPAAARALRAAGPFDALYSTSPGTLMHVAALIGRDRRVPWFAEFRDPWVDNALRDERDSMARRFARVLERRVFRDATGVVAVTEEAGRLFRGKLSPEGAKVIVALNGIDVLRQERSPTTRGAAAVLRLVYSGSLYPPRDVRPLLEALSSIRRGSAAVPPFEVVFVGDCRHYGAVDMEQCVADLGLADVTRFHDWLPTQEARKLVEEADLLLLPSQGWVFQVANKLFDYLGARVPILAIAERDSETERMLATAGGHWVTEERSVAALESLVRQALVTAGESRAVAVGAATALESWTVARQMQRLVAEVCAAVAAARAP